MYFSPEPCSVDRWCVLGTSHFSSPTEGCLDSDFVSLEYILVEPLVKWEFEHWHFFLFEFCSVKGKHPYRCQCCHFLDKGLLYAGALYLAFQLTYHIIVTGTYPLRERPHSLGVSANTHIHLNKEQLRTLVPQPVECRVTIARYVGPPQCYHVIHCESGSMLVLWGHHKDQASPPPPSSIVLLPLPLS